ncbi:site-2 protease family protein [bacterium]|nr:site-2 protease family protein [bacterium]
MERLIQMLPQLAVLIFSIVVHEVAHGVIALRHGDTTARDAGRLTLNPLPHIDLFGTILFPLILIISNAGFLFGWAKPVPVNPWRLRLPKKDMAFIGAAGPLSNLVLAVAAGLIFRTLLTTFGGSGILIRTLFYAVYINVILAIFNLIPIPPLDGSRILIAFLPQRTAERYIQFERYGMFIIFALMMLGFFRIILLPVANVLMQLIAGIPLY